MNHSIKRIAVLTFIAFFLLSIFLTAPIISVKASASTDKAPVMTPYVQMVNGQPVMTTPPANDAHWWDITYWNDYYGNHVAPGMSGEFTAVPNNIGGLAGGDLIWYLPLNVAIGTSSNFVWFQFGMAFTPGAVAMTIWDIQGNTFNEYIIGNGISYQAGHTYDYSLTTSGTNTVTFSVTDVTTSTTWSKSNWDFPIVSTNLVQNWNYFSPSCAVEGYTTNHQLTNLQTMTAKTGHDITNYWCSDTGSSMPLGTETYSHPDPTTGYYDWIWGTPGGSNYRRVVVDQIGLGNDATGNVVSYDGFTLTKAQLPANVVSPDGSVIPYTFNTVPGATGVQYVPTSVSGMGASGTSGSITTSQSGELLGFYNVQYYLTVNSAHGTPSPSSGWYNPGTPITASVDAIVTAGNTRYVCTGWSGTGDVPASGTTNSVTFTINSPSSITWNWKTQYYLTVSSLHGTPNPVSGWFDAGTLINANVPSPVAGPGGTQYVCTGWSGTGNVPASGTTNSVTFTINSPSSITWNWKTQYLLTMSTNFGTVSPSAGTYWYDAGSVVPISSTPLALPWDAVGQVKWTGWVGSGSGSYSGMNNPASVTMNGPVTETATWSVYTISARSSMFWYKAGAPLTISAGTNDPTVTQVTFGLFTQTDGWFDTVTTKTTIGQMFYFTDMETPSSAGNLMILISFLGPGGTLRYAYAINVQIES